LNKNTKSIGEKVADQVTKLICLIVREKIPEESVLEQIKNQLKASENKVKEVKEHFELITQDLLEQLETLTGFFQIMHNHSNSLKPAEIREFASRMDIAVKNILLNAGNIIEWRAIQNYKTTINIENVDLYAILFDTIHFFERIAEKKNITIIAIADKGMTVKADRSKLTYILKNLIHNSIKYTPQGGNVDVAAKKIGKNIELSIEDDGIGMSQKLIKEIFDPLNKTNSTEMDQSAKYGLKCVKSFIDLHHAKMEIKSENLKGTTVTIVFPFGS
jgi:signal transduction histidine kinase